jgi:3-oxoacyl-[acyl-carrier protein] reductase
MDLGLKGRVALVPAANKGIGKGVAMGLAREGAKVSICARTEDETERTSQEIRKSTGAEILTVQADLRLHDDIRRYVRESMDAFGRIDILVDNSGGPRPGAFLDFEDRDWVEAVDLVLLSSVRLCREVIPIMREAKWGRIIYIMSTSVKQPIDELVLSNVARPGVVGLAKNLSREFGNDSILVNTVLPGITTTDRSIQVIGHRSKKYGKSEEEIHADVLRELPLGRFAEPEEIADVVVFLASERASYLTGAVIQVDGGWIKSVY